MLSMCTPTSLKCDLGNKMLFLFGCHGATLPWCPREQQHYHGDSCQHLIIYRSSWSPEIPIDGHSQKENFVSALVFTSGWSKVVQLAVAAFLISLLWYLIAHCLGTWLNLVVLSTKWDQLLFQQKLCGLSTKIKPKLECASSTSITWSTQFHTTEWCQNFYSRGLMFRC